MGKSQFLYVKLLYSVGFYKLDKITQMYRPVEENVVSNLVI